MVHYKSLSGLQGWAEERSMIDCTPEYLRLGKDESGYYVLYFT